MYGSSRLTVILLVGIIERRLINCLLGIYEVHIQAIHMTRKDGRDRVTEHMT